MKTIKVLLPVALLLLTVSLMLPLGCTKETETGEPVPAELNSFSKYGFSFQYAKTFSVMEMGMLQNEASDESGLVQVGIENDEIQMFQTTWIKMIRSTWEAAGDLRGGLEDSFAGMEGAEGVAYFERGQVAETTKAGHEMLYQHYSMTSTEGDKADGIVGLFYCDKSQTVFQLMTMNDTISATQDVLEDFMNYVDSFACH